MTPRQNVETAGCEQGATGDAAAQKRRYGGLTEERVELHGEHGAGVYDISRVRFTRNVGKSRGVSHGRGPAARSRGKSRGVSRGTAPGNTREARRAGACCQTREEPTGSRRRPSSRARPPSTSRLNAGAGPSRLMPDTALSGQCGSRPSAVNAGAGL